MLYIIAPSDPSRWNSRNSKPHAVGTVRRAALKNVGAGLPRHHRPVQHYTRRTKSRLPCGKRVLVRASSRPRSSCKMCTQGNTSWRKTGDGSPPSKPHLRRWKHAPRMRGSIRRDTRDEGNKRWTFVFRAGFCGAQRERMQSSIEEWLFFFFFLVDM